MIKCDGCGRKDDDDSRLGKKGFHGIPGAPGIHCGGTWHEVKEEVGMPGVVPCTDAHLRQQASEAHGGAMATLHDWKQKNDETQRLRMELADERGRRDARAAQEERIGRELSWCQQEIRRLDPRLAAARWGKR